MTEQTKIKVSLTVAEAIKLLELASVQASRTGDCECVKSFKHQIKKAVAKAIAKKEAANE